MSAIVLISFHRYLNNIYDDIPRLFEYFRNYWEDYKGALTEQPLFGRLSMVLCG